MKSYQNDIFISKCEEKMFKINMKTLQKGNIEIKMLLLKNNMKSRLKRNFNIFSDLFNVFLF